MVKEATRIKVLRATAIAQELGLHNTSERLQRLPEKIARFKDITDPDRRLIQARWLSLDADFTEKTFKEDMKEKEEQIGRVGDSVEAGVLSLKSRTRGVFIVDAAFTLMSAYYIATGVLTLGNVAALAVSFAALNLTFFMTSSLIKSKMELLREGPKQIEEGIKELQKEVTALIERKA